MHRYRREFSVACAYALLLGILWWRAPLFFEGNALRNILVDGAPLLVATVGMTLVILARHIDISIGLQWAVCGVVAGLLAKAGVPMALVPLAAVLAAAALGA